MRMHWEYLTAICPYHYDLAKVQDWLNLHGREGWELISLEERGDPEGVPHLVAVFKRQLEERLV